MDLDIHLNGGDTLLGTCHLEVHVAEEIFQTLDIGQNQVIVVGLAGHQTAGDSGHHILDRHAGGHQGQSGGTDAGLGGGAVGLHGLRHGADGVGELFLGGKHRHQRALR